MPQPTVLVSPLYDPVTTGAVFARFPDVHFVFLPADGPLSGDAQRGLEQAEILLFGGMGKDRLSELIASAPRLRWIHTGSAGFDWVMVPEVEARGLTVTRSMDVMTIPMAEFALGVMLGHVKNMNELRDAQASRRWAPPMHAELHGATLGIVGAGSIGSRLAHLARAFGMRVVATKRDPQPLPEFDAVYAARDLDRLLGESDFVILTCPLTPETRGMMGAAQFGAMKPGAYLINLARGGLIVDADLIAALREQRIAGAWLDAFDEEPLPPGSPLWDVPGLSLSPHCSYRSPAIRGRVMENFSANLARYLRGEALQGTMRHAHLGY
ncbi:D-2-hydroxyacid dehydrogenase [Deinococcus radiopugnans]|uniref:D-2-hydroxyacid dehydrogenase n=1 Tax=Deinococcus radiopugnans TaxID=57497 RepID=UPI00068BEEE2|nr:D-2-hydroxyacid dehydrogenase [Deinococcus radiopugnans]